MLLDNEEQERRRGAHLEGRLSTMEAGHNQLHSDMSEIKASLSKIVEGSRTSWGVIISAVTMLITVMVLALTPLVYKMQENSLQVRDIADNTVTVGKQVSVLEAQMQSQKELTNILREHEDLLHDTATQIAVITSKISQHQANKNIHNGD